jgi:hypothetical protein
VNLVLHGGRRSNYGFERQSVDFFNTETAEWRKEEFPHQSCQLTETVLGRGQKFYYIESGTMHVYSIGDETSLTGMVTNLLERISKVGTSGSEQILAQFIDDELFVVSARRDKKRNPMNIILSTVFDEENGEIVWRRAPDSHFRKQKDVNLTEIKCTIQL